MQLIFSHIQKTWPDYDPGNQGGFLGTSLRLIPEPIDISEYNWVLDPEAFYNESMEGIKVEGSRGLYKVYWTNNTKSGIPNLKIQLDGEVIIEKDLNDYIDRITEKYPPRGGDSLEVNLEDMSLLVESLELRVFLVFNYTEIIIDPAYDDINYWFELNAIYIKEKE
jgi:hypothetical protein